MRGELVPIIAQLKRFLAEKLPFVVIEEKKEPDSVRCSLLFPYVRLKKGRIAIHAIIRSEPER